MAAVSEQQRKPQNPLVSVFLTDLYQITMAYAYWDHGKHEDPAVFELFHRKNPFKGEYTVFAGLHEVISFLADFRVTAEQIEFLRGWFKSSGGISDEGKLEGFLSWMGSLDCSQVRIHALSEGSLVFPRVPFLLVEGPLGVCQLLETPLLCLVNFPSLVATNASRFRLAVGPHKGLLEFGTRRAQGPDGALTASRYAYIGGFDGTSNVLAGQLFGIKLSGTMAHAFVSSFPSSAPLLERPLLSADGTHSANLSALATEALAALGHAESTNKGELAAFIAYAHSFPTSFLALVDTYHTVSSGIPNFIAVASALIKLGYQPRGLRLDSGDLCYLSRRGRELLQEAAAKLGQPALATCRIVASNDLNESTILSLNQQGHEIDVFGVGTNLVTCQSQPALGGVYKLVEVRGEPRIKISEDFDKVQIPGKKRAYRLYGAKGFPILDLLCRADEPAPQVGLQTLCLHPFVQGKRCFITPTRVETLHSLVWDGRVVGEPPSAESIRSLVLDQLEHMRPDHLRPLNPTPYKVAVSSKLHEYLHRVWMEHAPIPVLD